MISCFQATLELLSFIEDSLNLIINSLLAIATICASIFAGLTWRQAQKSHKEERKSRRTFIAPDDDPGFLKYNCEFDDDICFSTYLKNYGINPSTKLECKFNFFNNSQDFLFGYDTHASNPIPYNGRFIIELTKESLQKDDITINSIVLVKFISL